MKSFMMFPAFLLVGLMVVVGLMGGAAAGNSVLPGFGLVSGLGGLIVGLVSGGVVLQRVADWIDG